MEQLGVQNLENIAEQELEGLWRVSTADHRILGEAVLLKVHERANKRQLHESLKDQFTLLDQAMVSSQVERPLEIGRSESGRTFLVVPNQVRHALQDDLQPSTAKTWRSSVETLIDVARSVSQIHQAGLVHGQLDPTTIRVALGKETVITNFGLASFSHDLQLPVGPEPLAIHQHYLAPEVLQGEPVGQRSDVYGLGMTLFASLLGSVPFAGAADFSELSERIGNELPVELGEHIPLEVRDVIRQAISKHPQDRHPDATTFLLDLQTATPPIELSDHQPAFIPAVQNAGSRASFGLVPRVAIVAAILLGIGAIGAFATSRSPAEIHQEPQIKILGTTTVPETTTEREQVTTSLTSLPESSSTTSEAPTSTTIKSVSPSPTSKPRPTTKQTARPTTTRATTTRPTTTLTPTTTPTTSPSTTETSVVTIKPGPTSSTPAPTEPKPEPTDPPTTVQTVPSFTIPTFTLPSIPDLDLDL